MLPTSLHRQHPPISRMAGAALTSDLSNHLSLSKHPQLSFGGNQQHPNILRENCMAHRKPGKPNAGTEEELSLSLLGASPGLSMTTVICKMFLRPHPHRHQPIRMVGLKPLCLAKLCFIPSGLFYFCLCVLGVGCPQRPEDMVFPGADVTGSSKLPDMGAGN